MKERSAAWEFSTRTGASGGGITVVLGDVVPADSIDEIEAADIVHNGAVATDLAIGLFRAGEVVLFRSSATDAARPAAGVPVVLDRRASIPPGWQIIGAANNLAPAETVTVRFLFRRRLL